MRSSAVIVSLFAALAVASPVHQALHKRVYAYDVTTEIVTVTVTAGDEPETVRIQKTVYVQPSPRPKTKKKPSTTSVAPPPPPPTTTSQPPPPPPTTTSTPPPPPPPTTEAPAPVTTQAAVFVATSEAAPVESSPPAPDSSSGNKIKDTALNGHNGRRATHHVGALEWDEGLASAAQQLSDTCVFGHVTTFGGGGYGQNIGSQGSTNEAAFAGKEEEILSDAITAWYNEVEVFQGNSFGVPSQYGLANPLTQGWGGEVSSNGEKVMVDLLHFTQVVWKATTKIGCSVTYCGDKMGGGFFNYYTVCNYKSPGNFGGQYAQNVLAP